MLIRATVDRFRSLGRFVCSLMASITKHDISSLAAIIAFYALFSLFPLLLLVLYTASILVPETHGERWLVALIRPYFPAMSDATQFIANNIKRLSNAGAKVGLVSAMILACSATSGFIAVQQALDVVWETKQRSFIVRRLIAFAMLVVLLALALLSALVIIFYPVAAAAAEHLRTLHWLSVLPVVSSFIFPTTLFCGCLVLYRYLPSSTQDWSCIIPGALVATVMIDLGRGVFVWYAAHLVTYQLLYGGLAVVMMIILWMYLASIALLFGAEVGAALQQFDDQPTQQ